VDEMKVDDVELVDVEAVLHLEDVLQKDLQKVVVQLVNKKNINLFRLIFFYCCVPLAVSVTSVEEVSSTTGVVTAGASTFFGASFTIVKVFSYTSLFHSP
jgi:hypothetical protein